MQKYLVSFAQTHSEFRLPELQSIAELYGINYELENNDVEKPLMVILLESEEHARLLARRCILIKYVTRLSHIALLLSIVG
jgi:tRNA (guanine10-N2)-methyltransferase